MSCAVLRAPAFPRWSEFRLCLLIKKVGAVYRSHVTLPTVLLFFRLPSDKQCAE